MISKLVPPTIEKKESGMGEGGTPNLMVSGKKKLRTMLQRGVILGDGH